MMVCDRHVRSVQGTAVAIEADTVCLHGDNEQAVRFAKRLHAALQNEGIAIQAMRKETRR
jgi:5-oxoprolinase (ATP-hydrolysing) subunit A